MVKIESENAPAAIGPYSQGVIWEKLVLTSGQIPLDPNTGEVVKGGIEAQTRQVLDNLKTVLEAGGATLGSVLKTTCFLQNMEDFAAFNAIYTQYFGDIRPARSCIAAAALPKAVLCEVEAIAYQVV